MYIVTVKNKETGFKFDVELKTKPTAISVRDQFNAKEEFEAKAMIVKELD